MKKTLIYLSLALFALASCQKEASRNEEVSTKNLRTFKNTLHNFLRDYNNGIRWSIGDIQHALGLYSYYVMVDADTISATVETYREKTGVDIIKLMKQCLNE